MEKIILPNIAFILNVLWENGIIQKKSPEVFYNNGFS